MGQFYLRCFALKKFPSSLLRLWMLELQFRRFLYWRFQGKPNLGHFWSLICRCCKVFQCWTWCFELLQTHHQNDWRFHSEFDQKLIAGTSKNELVFPWWFGQKSWWDGRWFSKCLGWSWQFHQNHKRFQHLYCSGFDIQVGLERE